jgi:hypothetical protein
MFLRVAVIAEFAQTSGLWSQVNYYLWAVDFDVDRLIIAGIAGLV